MRLAVLPPLAVALSATAAVLFSIRSTGARTGPLLWAVLAGAVTVAVAGILIAAVAADRAARSVADRVDALRRTAARGEADLHALVDALRQGETPPQPGPRRRPPADADDFELLAADLARAYDGAVTAVVRAAQLSSRAGSEQKLEVFVNLARRLQSLVHREISILDDLENEIEDPDLLKGLFHVDHLATRIRRHAENLAVLGGAVSRRQWSNPVSMTEVLRSAIAEVEQYSRVKLVPPIDGELRGHAVADVIHLLAELIENATVFSAPHTQVLLRANLVTSGLAVEVEDGGLGMPVGEQSRMNALLADPDQVNVASLLADGRIGLYVVSQLARRHHIHVRLQTNIYGGVQAVLVVPQALLGNAPAVPVAGTGADKPQPQGRPPADTGASQQAAAAVPVPAQAPRSEGASGAGSAAGGGAGDAAEAGAGSGRRRHAQRGSGRHGAAGGTRGRHGAVPAPLPVRGAQETRPTPAEAVPGISPDDRPAVEAHAGVLPTPRVGPVRGTMDKPRLPRRRAQEHIVPQLRGGPAPRQESDTVTGHDPGLMAAFQRGIGLAEAQQGLEPEHGGPRHAATPVDGDPAHGQLGPAHTETAHMAGAHLPTATPDATEPARVRPGHGGGPEPLGAAHGGPYHRGSEHAGPGHRESGHVGAAYMTADHAGPTHMGSDHTDSDHMGSDHMGSGHMNSGHMGADYSTGSGHTDSGHTGEDYTGSGHTGSGHAGSGRTNPAPTAPGRPAQHHATQYNAAYSTAPDRTAPDHTARPDTALLHTAPPHTAPEHMAPPHTSPAPMSRDDMLPAPIPPAHAPSPAGDGGRGAGRPGGSAPAG
ncbi:ATPase [Streptomyces sp. NRRL B-3648]|nr:ATPase [Streptomyces sp. NRRL B-3648]